MFQDVGFGYYDGADFGADTQASTQPTGFWQNLSQKVLETGQKVAEDKLIKKQPPASAPTMTTIYQGIDTKYFIVAGVAVAAIVAIIIAKKRSQKYAT